MRPSTARVRGFETRWPKQFECSLPILGKDLRNSPILSSPTTQMMAPAQVLKRASRFKL